MLPDSRVAWFTSDGDMPSNNWKEYPNGQEYIDRARAEGRSDVLEWARANLAPKVQRVFNEYSEKYNWGDPGKSASAEKGWTKQEAQDQQRLQLALEADLLASLVPTSPMKNEETSKK